jgi:hypothetical protein
MLSSSKLKLNNCWLFLLLCIALFAARLYEYARPSLSSNGENLRPNFDWGTFLVYNYSLRLFFMVAFIGLFFLLFKTLAYFWKGVSNGHLMGIVLMSYFVFLLPTVLKGLYALLYPQASSGERMAFTRMFYLEKESDLNQLEGLGPRILAGVNYFEFGFFIVLFLLCYRRFEEVRVTTLALSILTLALVYFGIGALFTWMTF